MSISLSNEEHEKQNDETPNMEKESSKLGEKASMDDKDATPNPPI